MPWVRHPPAPLFWPRQMRQPLRLNRHIPFQFHQGNVAPCLNSESNSSVRPCRGGATPTRRGYDVDNSLNKISSTGRSPLWTRRGPVISRHAVGMDGTSLFGSCSCQIRQRSRSRSRSEVVLIAPPSIVGYCAIKTTWIPHSSLLVMVA
jgi:hypothetical protein